MKFYNQSLDPQVANVNPSLTTISQTQVQQNQTKNVPKSLPLVKQASPAIDDQKSFKKEYRFIHDVLDGNYIRMKTDHWEDFMFRSGISQAQRIFLTMPGSLYPTCV